MFSRSLFSLAAEGWLGAAIAFNLAKGAIAEGEPLGKAPTRHSAPASTHATGEWKFAGGGLNRGEAPLAA
eukprot:15454490-Alexandrium_andersonii.AAC.1